MKQYKCFRVWFRDGTAVLVDALDKHEAAKRAHIEYKQYVQRVECLS